MLVRLTALHPHSQAGSLALLSLAKSLMAALTLDRRQSRLSCSRALEASSLAPTPPEPAPVLPSQGAGHTLPNAIAFSPALNTFGTGSPMPLPPGPAFPDATASRGGKDSAPALMTPRTALSPTIMPPHGRPVAGPLLLCCQMRGRAHPLF